MEVVFKLIKAIKNSLDLKSWNQFEIILVSFIITIIMGSTFYFSYTTPYETFFDLILNWIISPVASITGIVCVVLVFLFTISIYWLDSLEEISYK